MEQITHFHEHHQQVSAKLTKVILQICHCHLQDFTWSHPSPSHHPFMTMTHPSNLNWKITVTKKPSHPPLSPLRFPFLLPCLPSLHFSSLSLLYLGCFHITQFYCYHYISHTLKEWLFPSLDRQLFQGWNSGTYLLGPDTQQASSKFQLNEKINQLLFE